MLYTLDITFLKMLYLKHVLRTLSFSHTVTPDKLIPSPLYEDSTGLSENRKSKVEKQTRALLKEIREEARDGQSAEFDRTQLDFNGLHARNM